MILSQVLLLSALDPLDSTTLSSEAKCKAMMNNQPVVLHITPVTLPEGISLECVNICCGISSINDEVSNSDEILQSCLIERISDTIVYRSKDCEHLVEDSVSTCSACRSLSEKLNTDTEEGSSKKAAGKFEFKFEPREIKKSQEEEDDQEEIKTEELDFGELVLPEEFVSALLTSEDSNKLKKKRKKHNTNASDESTEKPKKIRNRKLPDTPEACAAELERLMAKKLSSSSTVRAETQCSKCSLVFPSLHMMMLHRRAAHRRKLISDSGEYICEVCNQQCKDGVALYSHMRIHDQTVYQCTVCGDNVVGIMKFKRHKERHFRTKKTCPECGKEVSNLTFHINTMHKIDELKTWQCDICNKGFHTKNPYTNHMRIHSNERPFKCRFCDFHSKLQGNLTKHEKQRHPVEFEAAKDVKTICKSENFL